MHALNQLNIQSLLVEGGARLLQSFIDEGLWDETRVITGSANYNLSQRKSLHAPVLFNAIKTSETNLINDRIEIFKKSFD